ncbi:MAG: metalloregulator ArsR/SmtB family transcription factor [Gemmatimonadetes bacterium]|nr:metalloregulator ArsR/SmtB family transcription factor [Gemmatimonadota bacterium]
MDILTARPEILARLEALNDENRLRILVLLDRSEFTVSELTSVVQLPQSSVSRHLKVLSADGWLRVRADGTSRHYQLSPDLPEDQSGLWRVVRSSLAEAPWRDEDAERARAVLAERRRRSEEFFSGAAADWDALRVQLFGRSTEASLLLGLLDPAWTVADLGAGTGALAEAVAPFVRRVIALDRSPEMLAAARSRLADQPNAEVRAGELEAVPLDDGSVDLALLVLVLHYVPEPERALAEARRVLTPGGRLLVVDMREHGRPEYRQTMGHLWPGFSEERMRGWTRAAGFARYVHRGLVPDPDASGPLLFVGTATRT